MHLVHPLVEIVYPPMLHEKDRGRSETNDSMLVSPFPQERLHAGARSSRFA